MNRNRKRSQKFDLRRFLAFPLLCAAGEPFPREAVEQVLPVRGPLRRYLLLSGFRRLRNQAFSVFRTGIDWDGHREKIASNPPTGNTP